MRLRLETSKGRGIENDQQFDISQFERNWSVEIAKRHPQAKRRTEGSALYNCHGLTFASRRTRVTETQDLRYILLDDQWEEIQYADVLPGDIVVYFSDDGDANHSGIVVALHTQLQLPIVCSKWGNAGEFIHNLSDCPDIYGPLKQFYRCRL